MHLTQQRARHSADKEDRTDLAACNIRLHCVVEAHPTLVYGEQSTCTARQHMQPACFSRHADADADALVLGDVAQQFDPLIGGSANLWQGFPAAWQGWLQLA